MPFREYAEANSTQLNEPPTKVSGLQGGKSWKLIRIPAPWKDSQVFFEIFDIVAT